MDEKRDFEPVEENETADLTPIESDDDLGSIHGGNGTERGPKPR